MHCNGLRKMHLRCFFGLSVKVSYTLLFSLHHHHQIELISRILLALSQGFTTFHCCWKHINCAAHHEQVVYHQPTSYFIHLLSQISCTVVIVQENSWVFFEKFETLLSTTLLSKYLDLSVTENSSRNPSPHLI